MTTPAPKPTSNTAQPTKPTTLLITSIPPALALAGAAVFVIGFASQQDDPEVAASSAIVDVSTAADNTDETAPQVPLSSESGGAQSAEATSVPPVPVETDDLASDDQEMVDTLLSKFDYANGAFVGEYDDLCMARATVLSVGGAASLASRFGITPGTVDETMQNIFLPGDVKLSQTEAIALTDAYFACGMARFLLGEFGSLGRMRLWGEPPVEVAECIVEAFDMTLLRDWWATLYVDDPARSEQLDADFLAEEAEVLASCRGAEQSEGLGLGGAAQLNSLWQDCESGSLAACDVLDQLSELDSVAKSVARDCGEQGDRVNGFCTPGMRAAPGESHFGDNSEGLDAVANRCVADRDLTACDFLYFRSAPDSVAQGIGATCGGRVESAIPDCRTLLAES